MFNLGDQVPGCRYHLHFKALYSIAVFATQRLFSLKWVQRLQECHRFLEVAKDIGERPQYSELPNYRK